MKKFLILLVFVFLTSFAASEDTDITTATATCRSLLAGLQPCTVNDGSFFRRLVTPISATCCNQINEIGDKCPGLYRRRWFSVAHFSCEQQDIPSPSPQPSPSPSPPSPSPPSPSPPLPSPSTPSPSPPSPPVEPCNFIRVRPCLGEMADFIFGRSISGISAECCSTLIDLDESCGPAFFRWPFFGKSLKYCKSHP